MSLISKRIQLVSYVVDSKHSRNLLVQFTGIRKEMYIDILRLFRDAVRRIRPPKWRTHSWFLLHDNAPAHQLDLVKDFLTMNNVTKPKNHQHSSDLAPVDFYLFSRLKSALEWRGFCYYTDIIRNATEELKRFLQNGSHECFKQLDSRWHDCIVVQGDC